MISCPLDQHAGHRPAPSAVVVDEATGGTPDFPRSDRDRSGPGVGRGLVAAFDGKAVAAFVAQEPVVPAGVSHGRSLSAVPRVSAAVVQPPYHCFKAPDVIGNSGGDPRRHAQRSIYS